MSGKAQKCQQDCKDATQPYHHITTTRNAEGADLARTQNSLCHEVFVRKAFMR